MVNIPGGAPTGQVSNPTTSFVVHGSDGSSAPARFLFVGESGHLSGWAPNVPPPPPSTQAQDAVVTPGAVDKGLAIGMTDAGPMLYVADFSAGTVDVYNGLFQRVITAGNFQDRKLPDGFAPFNVAVLGGKVYVAYAMQDADREDEVAGAGHGPAGRVQPRRAPARPGRGSRAAERAVGPGDRAGGLRVVQRRPAGRQLR